MDQIEELLRTSGNKLSKADLQKILKRLNDTANQRLKNLEKSKKASRSFAYRKRQAKYKKGKNKGKPKKGKAGIAQRFRSPSKKTRGEYQKKITEAIKFLKSKSSTVKGVNEILNKFENDIGHFDNDEQIKEFFDTYHKMLEELGISRERRDNVYMALRGILYDLMNGEEPLTHEEMISRMDEIIDKLESFEDESLSQMSLDDLRELAKEPSEEDDDFDFSQTLGLPTTYKIFDDE